MGESTTLTVQGGDNYLWSTGETSSQITVTPTSNSVYTVTSTKNGCSASKNYAIQVSGLPISAGFSVSGNNQACPSFPLAISFTDTSLGSVSDLKWNFGDPSSGSNNTSTKTNPFHIYSVPGTYIITLIASTPSSTCSSASADTATYTVVLNASANFTFSSDTSICKGDSVLLSASGGMSYSWAPSADLSCVSCSNPVAKPDTTTTYNLTVINSTCTLTFPIQVTVHEIAISLAGKDSVCKGELTTLTASGGFVYQWNTTETTSSINVAPLLHETYTVTVSKESCKKSATINVGVVSSPDPIILGNDTLCLGQSTTLTAQGGDSYFWSTGETSSQITVSPLSNTIYSVTATKNGCKASKSFSLVISDLSVSAGFTVFGNNQPCATYPMTISFTDTSLGNISSILWNFGDSLSGSANTSNLANPSHSYSAPGTYSVTMISSATNTACSLVSTDTATFTLILNTPTNIVLGEDTTICKGDSAFLSVSGGTSYSWTPSSTLSCSNCSNPIASPNANTMYFLSAIDVNGCVLYDSVTVTVHKSYFSVTNDTVICAGDVIALQAFGGNDYEWSTGDVSNFTTVQPKIATEFFVTVTDGKCLQNLSVLVTPIPLLLSADDNIQVCKGDSVQLSVSEAHIYSWMNTSFDGKDITVLPFSDTTFVVIGTDTILGCQDTLEINVFLIETPEIKGDNKEICEGETVLLTVSGAESYSWNPGNLIGSSITVSPQKTQVYTVTGSNSFGCIDTASIKVFVNSIPSAVFEINSPKIEVNQKVILTTENNPAFYYTWSMGDNNTFITGLLSEYSYDKSGVYEICLYVESASGCLDSSCQEINVGSEWAIYAPNSFTPNGDRVNDQFTVKGIGINELKVLIFNRWGDKIAEFDDISKGWDGTTPQGHESPDGVYLYSVYAKFSNNKTIQKTGHVTLLK